MWLSDLGLQPRVVWNEPDRLLAEGRLVVPKTQVSRGVVGIVGCTGPLFHPLFLNDSHRSELNFNDSHRSELS
jgi:hypothetical protein